MGFPEGYTDISASTRTTRYQALGNSWAVPVVKWIGERLISETLPRLNITVEAYKLYAEHTKDGCYVFDFGREELVKFSDKTINCTSIPEEPRYKCLVDILSADAPKEIFISPVGCHGILRRKQERNMSINVRLEEVLTSISSQMSQEEIERRSRVQKRGKYSN